VYHLCSRDHLMQWWQVLSIISILHWLSMLTTNSSWLLSIASCRDDMSTHSLLIPVKPLLPALVLCLASAWCTAASSNCTTIWHSANGIDQLCLFHFLDFLQDIRQQARHGQQYVVGIAGHYCLPFPKLRNDRLLHLHANELLNITVTETNRTQLQSVVSVWYLGRLDESVCRCFSMVGSFHTRVEQCWSWGLHAWQEGAAQYMGTTQLQSVASGWYLARLGELLSRCFSMVGSFHTRVEQCWSWGLHAWQEGAAQYKGTTQLQSVASGWYLARLGELLSRCFSMVGSFHMRVEQRWSLGLHAWQEGAAQYMGTTQLQSVVSVWYLCRLDELVCRWWNMVGSSHAREELR
jgi:hypothetical protein